MSIQAPIEASAIHLAGVLATRPDASGENEGVLFLATDVAGGTLYRSDGDAWTKIAPGVAEAAGGVSPYLHQQDAPAATWSVAHGLGRNPVAIAVFDGSGRRVLVETQDINLNALEVRFASATTGKALLV